MKLYVVSGAIYHRASDELSQDLVSVHRTREEAEADMAGRVAERISTDWLPNCRETDREEFERTVERDGGLAGWNMDEVDA